MGLAGWWCPSRGSKTSRGTRSCRRGAFRTHEVEKQLEHAAGRKRADARFRRSRRPICRVPHALRAASSPVHVVFSFPVSSPSFTFFFFILASLLFPRAFFLLLPLLLPRSPSARRKAPAEDDGRSAHRERTPVGPRLGNLGGGPLGRASSRSGMRRRSGGRLPATGTSHGLQRWTWCPLPNDAAST